MTERNLHDALIAFCLVAALTLHLIGHTVVGLALLAGSLIARISFVQATLENGVEWVHVKFGDRAPIVMYGFVAILAAAIVYGVLR